MDKLILLNPGDNVLVACKTIETGEKIVVGGNTILCEKEIGLGHKIAAKDIQPGDLIIKYGVPIGSAISKIPVGSHVHLHNMKSDYIETYTLDHEY